MAKSNKPTRKNAHERRLDSMDRDNRDWDKVVRKAKRAKIKSGPRLKTFKYVVQDAFYLMNFNCGVIKARSIQAALGELDILRSSLTSIGPKQNLSLHELIPSNQPGPLREVNDPQKLWAWWQNDVRVGETLVFKPCGVLSVACQRKAAAKPRAIRVPKDQPVQPLKKGQEAKNKATSSPNI